MKKMLKNMYIDDGFVMTGYLLVSIFVLIAYLITVAFNYGEFDFMVYKNTYMYYMLFQFMVFSISLLHIKVEKSIAPLDCFKSLMKIVFLSMANIPLLLVIFIAGNMESFNFMVPLAMQSIFGMAVIVLRQWLLMEEKTSEHSGYISHFLVFFINILSLGFLYMYYVHSKSVITTFYDKRIPLIFFLNPLLSIGGYINTEITGYTQLGMLPVVWYCAFWCGCVILSMVILRFKYKKGEAT
ncbi:hypothetical protein OXPF_27940 [Oxobacter pfennigii]|uniref:ABC-2 family transporter protein n=1 Tax=Oxobacter pfennigii TaxID=36849 RepID=A0A0P8Y986_9CLOT|nr:hypothetical protein [Oxobacter pfennigii]KPU43353.1 hypothetical protein OXPF_27940 [Oxobacter pfennigii]